jgi:Ca2+-binding EF-hand superfamily protein
MASDDFTLDREALKKFFKCSEKECNTVFQYFDMDGNGKIDSYEFVCALALMAHGTLDVSSNHLITPYRKKQSWSSTCMTSMGASTSPGTSW